MNYKELANKINIEPQQFLENINYENKTDYLRKLEEENPKKYELEMLGALCMNLNTNATDLIYYKGDFSREHITSENIEVTKKKNTLDNTTYTIKYYSDLLGLKLKGFSEDLNITRLSHFSLMGLKRTNPFKYRMIIAGIVALNLEYTFEDIIAISIAKSKYKSKYEKAIKYVEQCIKKDRQYYNTLIEFLAHGTYRKAGEVLKLSQQGVKFKSDKQIVELQKAVDKKFGHVINLKTHFKGESHAKA